MGPTQCLCLASVTPGGKCGEPLMCLFRRPPEGGRRRIAQRKCNPSVLCVCVCVRVCISSSKREKHICKSALRHFSLLQNPSNECNEERPSICVKTQHVCSAANNARYLNARFVTQSSGVWVRPSSGSALQYNAIDPSGLVVFGVPVSKCNEPEHCPLHSLSCASTTS